MKFQYFFCFLLIICSSIGCNEKDNNPTLLNPQKIYSFERDGEQTVINRGQIVRHLLIQDLKIVIENLAKPGAEPIAFEELYKYYDNGNITIDGETLTPINGEILKPHLSWISSQRDLKFRVNPTWGDEITADIMQWCQTIADNSQDPNKLGTFWVYIDPETGYDLGEMFQKTALGGVAWSHGLNTYFKGVEHKNNEDIVVIGDVTLPYTEMEHHFDEVFGYFGTARNFLDFTDEDLSAVISGGNYRDNFVEDGLIDLETEYNYGFALEAANRDLSSWTTTDYSQTIFNALCEGRQAIVRQDYDSLVLMKEIILTNWEEVVATTAIHYINGTLSFVNHLVNEPNNSNFSYDSLYENWSAMYKYTEMLRYNYNNRFTEWEMVLHEKYETAEIPYPKALPDDPTKAAAYAEVLLEVRNLLQNTYNFDPEDVKRW